MHVRILPIMVGSIQGLWDTSLPFLVIQVVQGMGLLLRRWCLLKPDIGWSLPKFLTTFAPDYLVDMAECRTKAL